MTLLGKLICATRKLLRLRTAHDMKRVKSGVSTSTATGWTHETRDAGFNRCRRCGHTVPVKPRKPRAKEPA